MTLSPALRQARLHRRAAGPRGAVRVLRDPPPSLHLRGRPREPRAHPGAEAGPDHGADAVRGSGSGERGVNGVSVANKKMMIFKQTI